MTRLPSNGERIEEWDNPCQAGANGSVLHPAFCAGEEPPTGFDWRQEPHHILEVCNRWRVHARWWEADQTIWREYFKVTTDSGLLCLIYHDLQSGNWYLSRIYD
jgi:hypothetical protein